MLYFVNLEVIFEKPKKKNQKTQTNKKKPKPPKTLCSINMVKWLLEVWNYRAKSWSHAQTSTEPPALAHSA